MAFKSWNEFLESREKKDDIQGVDDEETNDKGFDKARKAQSPLDDPKEQPAFGYGRKPKQISADFSPSNKDASPYKAPNARNDGLPLARVADKWEDPIASTKTPNFDDPNASVTGGTYPNYKNLKTEEFHTVTKDMSDAEFIKNMINESKKEENKHKKKEDDFEPSLTCQFSGEKAMPAFYEVSKYASRLFPKNEKARKAFIRELKGVDGGLQLLLDDLLGHKETYNAIAESMANPETKVAKRMAQAMNNPYVEYISSFGNPLATNESVDLPVAKRRPGTSLKDRQKEDNAFDQPAPGEVHLADDDDLESSGMANAAHPNNVIDNPNTVKPSDTLPLQEPPSDSGPNPQGYFSPAPSTTESKKEFGYHHLIREMASYPHIKNFMSESLK